MASVKFWEVRIHRVSDPAEQIVHDAFGGMSVPTVQPGEVRTMANGRRRVVSRPTKFVAVDVQLPYLPRVKALQLEEWSGDIVMVRDPATPVGRLTYGVFFSVDVSEIDGGDLVHVSLPLEQVTYSPEV